MSWIFTVLVGISCAAAAMQGRGSELAAAVQQGAQAGITLSVSMAGSLCLWTGVGHLMEQLGITASLSRVLRPLLNFLFPSTKNDSQLAASLSANICANFLGLGNAATPMGIQSAQRLAKRAPDHIAGDELCRLIVMNTASIQLIPATVAALRVSHGCKTPFDILPAVWVTSLCSEALGLTAAYLLGKVWRHG